MSNRPPSPPIIYGWSLEKWQEKIEARAGNKVVLYEALKLMKGSGHVTQDEYDSLVGMLNSLSMEDVITAVGVIRSRYKRKRYVYRRRKTV